MLVNNPAAVALHEAKLLWPRHEIQCVVSCGTGRVNPTIGLHRDDPDLTKQASWKEKFTQILVSATDTEGRSFSSFCDSLTIFSKNGKKNLS